MSDDANVITSNDDSGNKKSKVGNIRFLFLLKSK